MKTVAVYTNEKKDGDLSVTKRVTDCLEGKCRVITPCDCASFDDMCKMADALIVLGGDGTLLRTSRKAARYGVPVLGINMGRVGYLAEIEPDMIEESISRYLAGKYQIEERFMIRVKLNRDGKVLNTYYALNDIVVSSNWFKKIISLDLHVDGDFVASYDADGVIVATPTGSTAYSLSAGGPIVDNGMELMIVTPICAHSLTSRPVIIPGDKKITIEIGKSKKRKAALTVDGQDTTELLVGDRVEISAGDIKTKFIRISGMNFYEVLRKKLSN